MWKGPFHCHECCGTAGKCSIVSSVKILIFKFIKNYYSGKLMRSIENIDL